MGRERCREGREEMRKFVPYEIRARLCNETRMTWGSGRQRDVRTVVTYRVPFSIVIEIRLRYVVLGAPTKY